MVNEWLVIQGTTLRAQVSDRCSKRLSNLLVYFNNSIRNFF
jgi:hypothetical protein